VQLLKFDCQHREWLREVDSVPEHTQCGRCAIEEATERLINAAKAGREASRSPEARAKHMATCNGARNRSHIARPQSSRSVRHHAEHVKALRYGADTRFTSDQSKHLRIELFREVERRTGKRNPAS
jgi:hypothetical protein